MSSKRKIKIVVVQRNSLVSNNVGMSRSIYARILEPFDIVVDSGEIEFKIVDEKILANEPSLLKPYDVVIFSKHVSDESIHISREAKKIGKAIIYDVDDYIINFPKYSGGQGASRKEENFRFHLNNSTMVSVAALPLQRELKGYAPNIKTNLVPNGINVERHRRFLKANPVSPRDANELRMVFTNADRIKVDTFRHGFFKTVNTYLDLHPKAELDVFIDQDVDAKDFVRFNNLGCVEWFVHKQMLAKGDYDVALVPLGAADDPDTLLFNSCKSPIKYLEYGCLGIVGIYSLSPIYECVIRNGETGILVSNEEDSWEEAMRQVSCDHALRKRIADNALEDIMVNHHAAKAGQVWVDLLEEAIYS